jgi:hypothetical protein
LKQIERKLWEEIVWQKPKREAPKKRKTSFLSFLNEFSLKNTLTSCHTFVNFCGQGTPFLMGNFLSKGTPNVPRQSTADLVPRDPQIRTQSKRIIFQEKLKNSAEKIRTSGEKNRTSIEKNREKIKDIPEKSNDDKGLERSQTKKYLFQSIESSPNTKSLLESCKRGDVKGVQAALLEEDTDLSAQDSQGDI